MLESDEAARRLGVKVSTLYAYVSRGLLVSHPAASGRRRLFDIDEVERLARRSRQGKAVETRMVTITTGITQLTEEGPIYRGRRATDLATRWRYEQAAEWLWGVDEDGPPIEPAMRLVMTPPPPMQMPPPARAAESSRSCRLVGLDLGRPRTSVRAIGSAGPW